MHDLINDLARFASGDFCFRLEGDDSGKTTERTRHLSYRATKDDSDQTFMAIKNPRLLRTLLCPSGWPSQVKQVEIICDFLPALKCLRLVELPANMGSLINLRHLDIHHTKLPEMPLQMGKLTKLRKLTDFFIGKQSGSSIKELGKVHHLSGALSVWNLQNVTDARDAFEANLKGKEHLEKLELIWDCDMDNSLVHERVLEQLQPPVNVKILSINGYGGTRFPDWVGNSSLPLLEELYIRSCPDLKKALFTHFPSLTTLDIGACEQFEIDKGAPVAPNLKELKLRSCSNLRSLPENMRSFLPSLEKLSIFHCPKLESFPAGGLPSKLEGLAIWGCDKLVAGRTQWDLQSLYVLSRFSIAESGVLECFPEETLLPSSLTHLEIRTQKNLKSLNYRGLKHLTSLRELTIMNCMEVSMPEEGLPPSISSVTIWQCPLLERECEMGMRKVPKYLRCPEYMIPGRKSV
ncbi:DISEASE RESISTANCE PROTEIN RP [Salix viminalis]|uniref:DISEASE RESISTANCE PROTEIN RP n=1 Tax=Salix viminalis TaxID=40686 RepID=A0A9Q0QA83_SALVM|nr:DISEASE RESISTANCE PROTEIN RP [Salix viminalis]